MKNLLFAALASVPVPSYAASADDSAIRVVIERFRTAIIAKDATALAALPLNDSITFVSSLDAATLAHIRTKRPQATRATAGSYADFIRDVTLAKPRQEEVFSNIVIHADGSVATVWFDYDFREDGVVTNFGHESWGAGPRRCRMEDQLDHLFDFGTGTQTVAARGLRTLISRRPAAPATSSPPLP